jgi:ribonucleoside-diphosphate reductase alpha chain
MSGGGIGVNYSRLRPEGAPLKRKGGFSTGPIALMNMVNEDGRFIMQGGSRRSAIWAGLRWSHADQHKFIRLKDWDKEVRDLKAKNFNFPAPMDMTNISTALDDEFFDAYHDTTHTKNAHAQSVYWAAVERMLKTGEPGFSIDVGPNAGEDLRNACTEVTSADDSDVCNLGSINLARIDSLDEMQKVTELATIFLLAGTLYSDLPYDKVYQVREKNRRLGLGVMGLHEWLIARGKKYGPDVELGKYLEIYGGSTFVAWIWADRLGISRPVKTRAIAPTGTIGILAETTTGIEPIFCAAYKRRYLKHKTWHYQYNIDPVVRNLVDQGVNPDNIEDAYSISPERRVAFQAWVQQYVDHGISSTINLPAWGSEANNESLVKDFGNMLLKYLPKLRGITCYPDGSRGGQPLTPVKYHTALKHLGQIFEEKGEEKEPSPALAVPFDVKDAEAVVKEMTDFEASKPLDVCDLRGGGSCGV